MPGAKYFRMMPVNAQRDISISGAVSQSHDIDRSTQSGSSARFKHSGSKPNKTKCTFGVLSFTAMTCLLTVPTIIYRVNMTNQQFGENCDSSAASHFDMSFGIFDELNKEEYINVLETLRHQVSPKLYAYDPRVDESITEDDELANIHYTKSQKRLNSLDYQLQLSSDILWLVQLHSWSKVDRLEYLSQRFGESMHSLIRSFHAVILHGSYKPPEIREYIIKPKSSSSLDFTVQLHKTLSYNKRPRSMSEYNALLDVLAITCAKLQDILHVAYNASFMFVKPKPAWFSTMSDFQTDDSDFPIGMCQDQQLFLESAAGNPNCLIPMYAPPEVGHTPPIRKTWFRLVRQVAPFNQYPVDFQIQIEHSSLDPSDWEVTQIWFQGKNYKSVNQLLHLHNSGQVIIIHRPFIDLYPGQMQPTDVTETPKITNAAATITKFTNLLHVQHENKHAMEKPSDSLLIERTPCGKATSHLFESGRIKIHKRRVRYGNWDFHVTVRRETGLRIYGLHYDSKLLISEAGLDETVTSYWGFTPFMRAMTSLESVYGVGDWASELAPGIDCPHDAIFLPVQMVPADSTRPRIIKQGICIFEWLVQPEGGPVRRHFEFLDVDTAASDNAKHTHFASGVPARALVVRMISTLFNYDYLFDFILHQSGVVEFAVSPTGYVHVDTVLPENRVQVMTGQDSWHRPETYGFLSDQTPIYFVIHQHLFHYKIDLDILGTKNHMRVVCIHGPSNTINQTNPPELWMSVWKPENEMDARFDMDLEQPKQYLFCQEHSNGNHNPKCVTLLNKSPLRNFFSQSHSKSFSWAKHQVVVTRQDDMEPFASSLYNAIDRDEPVVNFDDFSGNNETIIDKDLVAWVTIGNYHLPRNEDLPNTVTSGGRLSFLIQPHNIFSHSPDAHSCDRVFTRNLEQWIAGFKEVDTCLLHDLPSE